VYVNLDRHEDGRVHHREVRVAAVLAHQVAGPPQALEGIAGSRSISRRVAARAPARARAHGGSG
jgi:hypothetical protein